MCYIGLEFTESRPLGATWALDALWNRLGLAAVIRRLGAERHLDDSAERVLFALVANRVLAPSSSRAAARWVTEDVMISGLPATTDDDCYQALGWLPEIKDALERAVFDRITDQRGPEVDLLFFDTTADLRETDRSQVVGMAVTRHGIPVRAWRWPQHTADSALIRQVRADMRGWAPARIVWVAGHSFPSADTRHYLREDGGQYIIGEKLRSAEAAAALSQPGRYQQVAANLRVKEVRISSGERFVICHDPEGAGRDAAIRARLLTELEEIIRGTDTLSRAMRAEKLRGFIVARHGRHPYLRVTADGLLRVDVKAVRADAKLDGKYLLRASDSDPAMTAEDIALGYRRMLQVERSWREMRQTVDLAPVYHREQAGNRAEVLLSWLAVLLARVTENACHETWPKLRTELDRIAIGTFTGPAGTFRQRTRITGGQLDILAKLAIDPPPRISHFTPAGNGPA